MDYIGNKCPVCQKYFHADDDIVVCPECGTPHHRECYEQTGHCINESLHEQGYDYQQEHAEQKEKVKVCPSCGKENDNEAFFCKHCGSPLSSDSTQKDGTPNAQRDPSGSFGADQAGSTPFGMPFLDPLGGVPGDSDFGDGVTAGEAAKYVKQNTPYFIRVFSNIKNFNKSKFNFAAAIFTGGYLLYRKMYKIGAIFASIQLLLMIVEAYISVAYATLFTNFTELVYSSGNTAQMVSGFYDFMTGLSVTEMLVLYLPTLIDVMRLAMMIVLGVCFNRMYMTHCKKQIVKIKETAAEGVNPEAELQTKGGVNTALAISLLVAYIIIVYLPGIIVNYL